MAHAGIVIILRGVSGHRMISLKAANRGANGTAAGVFIKRGLKCLLVLLYFIYPIRSTAFYCMNI